MNSCPPWLFWACSAAGLLGASAQLAPGWDYGLWRGPTWDTGLVGYYTFDGDVHDSGSLGTGAEVATAAEFTTDARCPGGMALVLSNTSTGFVHNKASGFPLGGTPMSMSMWVKTEDEGTSDLVMLGTWEGMKGYMIEVNDGFNSLYIRYGIPQIWVGDSSHDWQHILITYTGTHYEGYSSTQNYSYETTPYYTDVPLVLTVGSNEAGVGTHYIDDLKFYDRVVTLEESAPCSFATAAPPTIVPTPAPPTILRTGSPPTESPSGGGGLFSKELGSAGTAAGAGVVAGAAGLVTFGSAYAAARISLVTRACSRHFGMSAGEEENVYPRAMHPLQATVVDSHDLGAVMYNSLIALGLFFLFIVVVSLAKDLNLLPTTARDPHGYLSFPSIPLFVWQFLYLGTTFGAARLVFSPSFAQSEFVGGPVLAVCASLPLLIFLWVRSRCPKHALFEPVVDPDSESEGVGWEREPRVLVWLVGPGEWVSRTAEYDWVNRYGSLTRGLRPGREWWASVECLTSFTLACVLAVEPSDRTACGHVRLVCACIYLARFALDWAMTPFVKGLQTVGQPCMHAIQGVGLTLLAGALYSESTTLFDAGDMVLLVAAVALIILTLLEAVGEVVLFLTGRRHRLRARVIEREKELFVPCSFFDPCTPPDSSNTDESVTSELQGFVSKTVPSPFARLRPKGTSELSLDRTRSRYLADDPLPAPLSVCSSSYFDDSPFAFMSPPLESILSPTARSLSVNNRYSTPSMSMLPPASRVGSRRRGLVLDVRSNDAFDDDTALPVTRKSTVAVRPNPLLKL
ncbi:hypothetical protein DIPPA_21795 [Diplonema papillatum]|nr:hypothetical protein DIPPA_21795 [Diplonema papillatum]